jgi:hypothetical protein
MLRHSWRLENGPDERLPSSSIPYQPGLMPRMSDLSSLMQYGMVIAALPCAAASFKPGPGPISRPALFVVAGSSRGHPTRGHGVLISPAPNAALTWIVILPADGTALPNGGNGDFGTSPIYGQISDKPLLAFIELHGVPNANHNSGSRS